MALSPEQRRTEFLALMQRADWSAAETARRLHMSEGSISGYKKDDHPNYPPLKTLEALRDKVQKFVDENEESSGNNLEPSHSRGVHKQPRVLLQRAEREKVFSLAEQPGGRESGDPEIRELIASMELLRAVDPAAYNHLKDYITVCRDRVIHDSQQGKKKPSSKTTSAGAKLLKKHVPSSEHDSSKP